MWEQLTIFGFESLWSPIFLLFCIGIIGIYYYLNFKFGKKVDSADRVTGKQQTSFVVGVVLLYLANGGPLDLLGHIMFTAHMVQMATLFIVVTPLLIVGIPNWMHKKIVETKIVKAILNTIGKPLIAIFIFNGVFSLYHLPAIFDVVKTSMTLHSIYIITMFFCSFIMWWPVLNPLKEGQTLSYLQKIAYMFGNGVLLTPACALIIFASHPLYETYTDPRMWGQAMQLCVSPDIMNSLNISGPEFFGVTSTLRDQQSGGVVMKIFQEIVYGIIIGYVFFKWVKIEKKTEVVVPEYVRMQQIKKGVKNNENPRITNN
ncbi:MAG: cytochrome c oxidase assembly factor CtaG [Bacillaceae bacterium]